jgi:two-component system, cell cycle sensor histidine kinase PleC
LEKAHIRELFFRDKAMRLPVPWTNTRGLRISERSLRILITVLASAFLLALATALVSQLLDYRERHFEERGDSLLLQADRAALSIQLRLLDDVAGRTMRLCSMM